MRTAIAWLTRFLLALGLCVMSVACGGASPDATVTIIIPWSKGTAEYNAFAFVVNGFEEKHHGIQIILEVTRAVDQQLAFDQAAGDPPDLVDLPSPAAVEQYEGKGLKRLYIKLKSYDEPWRNLAESAQGIVYAVPVKADVKSLIWYKTSVSPPATWAELENISSHGSPWCLGLFSGSASGWPGADWVADILLSKYQAGPYENWLAGDLPWTSSEIAGAWRTWGSLMRHGAAINGGKAAALKTEFSKAMHDRNCEFEHGALSATGLMSKDRYNYVPFPDASVAAAPVMVSGDFMGLFTSNPNARKLLAYLASDSAQKSWVRRPGAYAMSADADVQPKVYPLQIQRKIAGLLQPSAHKELCFGAEDMMVPDVSAAFSQAVLDYISGSYSLRTLLQGLQKTQIGAGSFPVASRACASQ